MIKPIYLDYAAGTPLDERVLEKMGPYFSGKFHNPSAAYLAARAAKNDLEAARAAIAGLLGAKKPEIIFTAGATEANNLAIQGVMRRFPMAEALVSAIEHESVLAPARLFKHRQVPVSKAGLVETAALKKKITHHTALISIGLVNNELGTIQPLREIAQAIEEVRNQRRNAGIELPLYLHTDAAQAGNFLALQVVRLGVDLMSINGGKVYGPKQSGALYVRAGTQLWPLVLGGGQEQGMRSGTENVAGNVGLAEAFSLAQQMREKEAKRTTGLRDNFATKLQKIIDNTLINSPKKQSAPHILSISFPGTDNERLMMELDERGIQCAVGSACSASLEEPSHVLTAIGLPPDLIRSTLRFSLGRQTNEEDLRYAGEVLAELVAQHR